MKVTLEIIGRILMIICPTLSLNQRADGENAIVYAHPCGKKDSDNFWHIMYQKVKEFIIGEGFDGAIVEIQQFDGQKFNESPIIIHCLKVANEVVEVKQFSVHKSINAPVVLEGLDEVHIQEGMSEGDVGINVVAPCALLPNYDYTFYFPLKMHELSETEGQNLLYLEDRAKDFKKIVRNFSEVLLPYIDYKVKTFEKTKFFSIYPPKISFIKRDGIITEDEEDSGNFSDSMNGGFSLGYASIIKKVENKEKELNLDIGRD